MIDRVSITLMTIAVLWGSYPTRAVAQESRFFRVVGPVSVAITNLHVDGTIVWTNSPTNGIFTIQTATLLTPETDWTDYAQVTVSNTVTAYELYDRAPPPGMVPIPAGTFTMGDTLEEGQTDALPLRTVFVSTFYMDRYEVTKTLWDEVKGWSIDNGYEYDNPGDGKAAGHPAQSMNWYDIVKWCNARSQKEGLKPVYYTDSAFTAVCKTEHVEPYADWTAKGYRLPTEAEWEKAARGGSNGRRYPWTDTDEITHAKANYRSRTIEEYDTSPTRGDHPAFDDGVTPFTNPVGYFAPNGYGLYDMAGNVWEWCWDWYGDYDADALIDPKGPPSGTHRVDRGGSWDYSGWAARNAFRGHGGFSTYIGSSLGFRTVRAANE